MEFASNESIRVLITQINAAKDLLNNNLDKMKRLIEDNSSIRSRMELNEIQSYMKKAMELAEKDKTKSM